MKKTFALLLALCMVLTMLVGCGSTEIRSFSEDNAASQTDPVAVAMDAYAPDTVVMTINGSEVHWNEYAYWLCSNASQMMAYVGAVEDWNAVFDEETGETYADMLKEAVVQSLTQYHVLETKAAEYGVELGEAGEQYVEDSIAETTAAIGSAAATEAGFESFLKGHYLDSDVLRYQAKISYLYLQLFSKQFGENGEKLSDSAIADYVAENNYVTAKHILFSTKNEDGSDISDSEKAAKLRQAENVVTRLRRLQDNEDKTELLEQFDKYSEEYNEDPGVQVYTGGYCFVSGGGQMDEAFDAGVAALEPYTVSDPVESAFGYHVILRLPTTGDDVLEIGSDGSAYLLRSEAALSAYNDLSTAWMEEAEVVPAEGFEDLDLNVVFTPKETFWQKLDVFGWFH